VRDAFLTSERVTGEVVDSGKPFDPSLEREIALSGHERPVGGLGLLLVRRLTESLAYERLGRAQSNDFLDRPDKWSLN
jgi:anti-sigma regulatory factor (Ser/Thr protein kinase)